MPTPQKLMDLSDRTVWQFAAGGKHRDYSDLLIDWDVIVLGPGRFGPWPDCEEDLKEEGISSTKRTEIQTFYEDIEPQDLIVLRRRTTEVYALGEVIGQARHESAFSDVDGWDLQHTRRVRWLWTYDDAPETFASYALKYGGTLHENVKPPIEAWIESIDTSKQAQERELRPLPANPGKKIDVEDISRYLFDHGVSTRAIDGLAAEIGELNRIAQWYGRSKATPSESETVAYLVIPLLRALGWTPQKMAVEWQFIDLALFESLPREDETLIAAVEAKKWRSSCLSARSQAERYANERAGDACRRLVVTDGRRYGVFVRKESTFPERPTAYLNLADLRDGYPIMESDGAQEALRLMSAGWN